MKDFNCKYNLSFDGINEFAVLLHNYETKNDEGHVSFKLRCFTLQTDSRVYPLWRQMCPYRL